MGVGVGVGVGCRHDPILLLLLLLLVLFIGLGSCPHRGERLPTAPLEADEGFFWGGGREAPPRVKGRAPPPFFFPIFVPPLCVGGRGGRLG